MDLVARRQARRRDHGSRREGRRAEDPRRSATSRSPAAASCTASSPISRVIDVTPDGLVLRDGQGRLKEKFKIVQSQISKESWSASSCPKRRQRPTRGKGKMRVFEGGLRPCSQRRTNHNFEVCPSCGHHHPLSADGWRRLMLDGGELAVWDADLEPWIRCVSRTERLTKSASSARQKRASARESSRKSERHGSTVSDRFRRIHLRVHGWEHGLGRGRKITRLFERAREQKLQSFFFKPRVAPACRKEF